MFGFLAILAAWFGYKKAREAGRNGWIWGALCGVTFIGLHMVARLAIGVFSLVATEVWGWGPVYWTWYLELASIIPSMAIVVLIFRFLDKMARTDDGDAPPPPPKFDEGELLDPHN
jgi:hypothetical protein